MAYKDPAFQSAIVDQHPLSITGLKPHVAQAASRTFDVAQAWRICAGRLMNAEPLAVGNANHAIARRIERKCI